MSVVANRGFRNVTLFEITGADTDGYPTVGAPFSLGSANKLNNKALSLTDNVQEQPFEADDVVETLRTVVSKSGTLTVYDVTAASLVKLGLAELDDNENLIEKKSSKRFVLFFETEKSDGTKMQHWFYNVAVEAAPDTHESFNGTNAAELELPITMFKSVEIAGEKRFKVNVYSGKTGFVNGTPETIYKAVITPPQG